MTIKTNDSDSEFSKETLQKFLSTFSPQKGVNGYDTSDILYSYLQTNEEQRDSIIISLHKIINSIEILINKQSSNVRITQNKTNDNILNDNDNNEREEEMDDKFNYIINELRDLKSENKIISNNIQNLKENTRTQIENIKSENALNSNNIKDQNTVTRWVITLIVTVGIALIGFGINGINDNIKSIKENNQLQIQKEVSQSFVGFLLNGGKFKTKTNKKQKAK